MDKAWTAAQKCYKTIWNFHLLIFKAKYLSI